jgi:hypothetical protein
VLPNLGVEPKGFADWIEAVCMCPITYHTLSWSVAVRRSSSACQTRLDDQRFALQHKGKALRRIGSTLARIDSLNRWCMELLILAMITMATYELDSVEPIEHHYECLLVPHSAVLQWQSTFGDLKFVPEHAKAALQLVNRLGGASTLEFPGLQLKVS